MPVVELPIRARPGARGEPLRRRKRRGQRGRHCRPQTADRGARAADPFRPVTGAARARPRGGGCGAARRRSGAGGAARGAGHGRWCCHRFLCGAGGPPRRPCWCRPGALVRLRPGLVPAGARRFRACAGPLDPGPRAQRSGDPLGDGGRARLWPSGHGAGRGPAARPDGEPAPAAGGRARWRHRLPAAAAGEPARPDRGSDPMAASKRAELAGSRPTGRWAGLLRRRPHPLPGREARELAPRMG